MHVIYDVSHNVAKIEEHMVNGRPKKLLVHRKGATRAFPPNHPMIPADYQSIGQPVLVGGTMGTCSYVLTGTEQAMNETFGSTCHGAVSDGKTISNLRPNLISFLFLPNNRVELCHEPKHEVNCNTRTSSTTWNPLALPFELRHQNWWWKRLQNRTKMLPMWSIHAKRQGWARSVWNWDRLEWSKDKLRLEINGKMNFRTKKICEICDLKNWIQIWISSMNHCDGNSFRLDTKQMTSFSKNAILMNERVLHFLWCRRIFIEWKCSLNKS